MIIVLILLYFSLVGHFIPKDHQNQSFLRKAFLKATLVLSGLFYISTELLSALHYLDTTGARIFWSISTIMALFFALKKTPKFPSIIFETIKHFFQQKEYLLYAILAMCLPLLFLTIYIPSTNNDSLNYHVSRVIYWIFNKNVDYFPTLNGRQLYYSPYAEYVILQLQLLTQKIIYSNLPQFISMMGSLVTISLISEKLFVNKAARNLSVLLAFTLPIGLFESTTTQNDYVSAFFTILSLYFFMEIYQKLSWGNLFLFSLSLSISGLTKYSGWVFATPFFIFYGVLILKKYQLQVLKFIPLALLVFVVVLAPFTQRNLETFHHPLGPQEGEELYYDVMSKNFGVIQTISTTVKNIGTASATPIPIINKVIKKSTVLINKVLGKDVNSKEDNFLNLPYSNSFSFHEDRASNFIHFWLFLISIIAVFFVQEKKKSFIYLGLLWASFILFSILFKWQPWHSRMELVWLVMMMPFLGYVYSEFFKNRFLKYTLNGLLIIYAIAIIFLNPSKQLIPVINLSGVMPSFFSENDMEILAPKPELKSKVIENTKALKEFGLNFYLPKEQVNYTEKEKSEILSILDFPKNLSIYRKSYIERMMPQDMTVYHQIQKMMPYIDQPNCNIGLSLLAGTREFLVLYPLSLKSNISSIKNIAYPKSLSQTPNALEEYQYDYLLTNNFLLFNEIDSQTVESIRDFAYFKLYKFKSPQTKKYEVKDILQNFTM